ncbi:putative oxidoreductase [Prauserella sediminis]|uniref:Putative oxidoreductase n=1 Tax=Prauserella sediminis TaxID=577680 RepID=A0A839XVT7_9PSEU|nr:DoxX family protein [Prauserella sediminis]MBB3665494.1 putative oxidoreductase [Prauserella sediminis]
MTRKLQARGNAGREVAAVLLRAAIGGTMIAHGVKHGRSLAGTAGWFSSIGFRRPRLQARASAVVEVGAGALMVMGAATPLASAAVVGTMGVAGRAVHASNGFFITAEGWEYVANLAVGAVALAGIGPGRFSVDRATGADRRLSGAQAAAVAGGLGAAAAAGQLAMFHRPAVPAPEGEAPPEKS